MGKREVTEFLTHLAVERQVSANTQNQALNALNFLYRAVVDRPLGELSGVVPARNPTRFRWSWQYVFPAQRRSIDPRSGIERRHHIDEGAVQKSVKRAVRKAGIEKPASCHTLRHSFATHLLERAQSLLLFV